MKRKLSALLALAVIIACLSGCGAAPAPQETPEPSPSPTASPEPEKAPGPYDEAFARYGQDEIVMTVNGEAVTWGEYFYWISSFAAQLEQLFGEIDWSASADGQSTYQSSAQAYAEDTLRQYCVVAQKAAELGLELDEADREQIDSIYTDDVAKFGGGDEQAFEEYISERYIPRAMYDKLNELSAHYVNIFEHYFGVMGANLPDADVLSYAEDSGYMHAKHILLRTVDDGGSPLSDEEIQAAKEKADEILSQLKDLSGDGLEARFDELMNENSEDTGLAGAPNGYYFPPGQMVKPFEDAVLALGEGELCPEPVESTYGYHIILRLPLDIDQEMDYRGYTMRYVAASALFENMSSEWYETAEVEFTDKFTQLDFNELFGKPAAAPEASPTPEASPAPEAPAEN